MTSSDRPLDETGGNATRDALERFVARWRSVVPPARIEADPQWPSPCEIGAPDPSGRVRWEPAYRAHHGAHPALTVGLANAIGEPVHADFVAYWCTFWAAGFEATASEGHVSLLQLWNEEDVVRLVENQIGHVLVRRKRSAPLTLFFACTEADSDLVLCVRNDTGAVVLERPGVGVLETVAPDLAGFLDRLAPAAGDPADRDPPDLEPVDPT